MKNNSKFFCNKECEYFPCHELKVINCLFCFCPLYDYFNCGGNFLMDKDGLKYCSECNLPHEDYNYVVEFLKKNGI